MPVDNWPSTVPSCFILGSQNENIGDGLLRSQMDTGPAKIRRRSSAMPSTLSGSIKMSGAEIDALKAFVVGTLMGGALPFNFPNQRGGTSLVRLAAMPTWQRVTGDTYLVGFSFEVLP